MKKYLSVLEQCPLFDGIEAGQMTAMLGCMGAKVKEYGKGESVFAEGEAAVYVGVVLSGSAQIVREDFYGNRSIVASIEPGQLFGETFACAGAARIPVSVVSVERSEIMLVDCRRITVTCSNACAFHGRMILNLLRVVAQKNMVLNRKIEITSKRTTRDKLMTYLMGEAKRAGSAEFTIPFDRQNLADYLGVERSAMSAELGKLRREGVLEADKSRFRLLKAEAGEE